MTKPSFSTASKTYDPNNEQAFRTALANFLATLVVSGSPGVIVSTSGGALAELGVEIDNGTPIPTATTPPV